MGGCCFSEEQWKELAGKAHYNANNLARLSGLSVRQLQRKFRSMKGRYPQKWLNIQKNIAAQRLILSGEQIKKVAFDLEFKQVSHFCRVFKMFNDMTPSEFRIESKRKNFKKCYSQMTDTYLNGSWRNFPENSRNSPGKSG
jgi:AraC-like DNA-binding protein